MGSPILSRERAVPVDSPNDVRGERGVKDNSSSHPAVSVGACSDAGRKRPDNEDSYLIFDLASRVTHPDDAEIALDLESPGLLLAVADGMGGHQAGQVASQLCIEVLTTEFFRGLDRFETERDIDWMRILVDAAEAANQQVSQAARDNPENHGMGTTLTAALLTERDARIVQVGDSRAYLYHDGVLAQLTRDQTIGNSLLAAHQEMKTDARFSEMLVQAVGSVDKLEAEVITASLEPGDRLLICCDGLYKTVDQTSIARVLDSPGPLITKGRDLIARANAAGGPDNITVVLAELQTPR